MKTLKVGVIGLGGQGRGHAKAMMKAKGNVPYELVAVCDVRPETFEKLSVQGNLKENSSAIGFDAYNRYTSADEMFAKEDLDFVVIAIPTYLHCEMTVKALRAGCHVLCEKPMATTVAECDVSAADVMLNSNVFHNELTKLTGFAEVKAWQGTSETAHALPDVTSNSTINITTSSGATVEQSGIIGAIADKEAIFTGLMDRYMASDRNNADRYTNVNSGCTGQWCNDLTENGVVFIATV